MHQARASNLFKDTPPSLASVLAEGRVALFLDFDGTLVELASGPDAITPRADLAARLEALAERLGGTCAIVSGRAIADIERHIGLLRVAAAGSHGSDIRTASGEKLGEGAKALPQAIEQALREFAQTNALDYEHKPHGGALHYRSAPERGAEAHAFAEALAAEHGWAAQSGKCVVELVAPDANKGSAVATLMASEPFAGAQPLFLGDDLTDEAGFAACKRLGGKGILVGTARETQADYHLPDVTLVHNWLEF